MPLPSIISSNLLPVGALAPIGPPPGGATSATTPPGGAAARALSFSMQPQEQYNWCWAAVSVSVAHFSNSATIWTQQCDIASAELALPCCPPGSNAACDVPWFLDLALGRVGHFNTWQVGVVTFGNIKAELDAGRPLGAHIEWSSGGGHFVILSGYSTSPSGDSVTVEDPLHGQSTILHSELKRTYRLTGNWTHSFWTQP